MNIFFIFVIPLAGGNNKGKQGLFIRCRFPDFSERVNYFAWKKF